MKVREMTFNSKVGLYDWIHAAFPAHRGSGNDSSREDILLFRVPVVSSCYHASWLAGLRRKTGFVFVKV